MINLLYIESNVDGTIGGSYYSLLFLLQNLDKNKYSPAVVFYGDNELIEKYEEAGCTVLLLKKPQPLNLADSSSTFRFKGSFLKRTICLIANITQKIINPFYTFIFPSFHCWKILRERKIDVVHLNNTILRPQEWILASIFSYTKVVAHERGINTSFPLQYRLWVRHLKAIFCISKSVETNLLTHGFPRKQLHLVYNGLDPDIYKPKVNKLSILEKLGIAENSFIVGVVGNIKQWKGQIILIRAINLVLKKIPNVQCLIIGGYSRDDEEYMNQIQDFVRANGLGDNIVFTGHQRDVASHINVLDILAHTSVLPEPFGRVLLEGMALRKPVITPDIGAGPEIVNNNETGLVYKSSDHEDLANAIIYLFEHPELAKKMGSSGFNRLESEFHIQKSVNKTTAIYDEILSR